MRILLCDDSKSVHSMMNTMFVGSEFHLDHAYHAAECVQLLEDFSGYIAAFIDWEMPDVTGVKLVRLLRNSGFDLPLIMLTGKNSEQAIQEALQAGAFGYVMKPFTRDLLLASLEGLGSLAKS